MLTEGAVVFLAVAAAIGCLLRAAMPGRQFQAASRRLLDVGELVWLSFTSTQIYGSSHNASFLEEAAVLLLNMGIIMVTIAIHGSALGVVTASLAALVFLWLLGDLLLRVGLAAASAAAALFGVIVLTFAVFVSIIFVAVTLATLCTAVAVRILATALQASVAAIAFICNCIAWLTLAPAFALRYPIAATGVDQVEARTVLLRLLLSSTAASGMLTLFALPVEAVAVAGAWHVWLPLGFLSVSVGLVAPIVDTCAVVGSTLALAVAGAVGGHLVVFRAIVARCFVPDDMDDIEVYQLAFARFQGMWAVTLRALWQVARDRAGFMAVTMVWTAHVSVAVATTGALHERTRHRLLLHALLPSVHLLQAGLQFSGLLIGVGLTWPLRRYAPSLLEANAATRSLARLTLQHALRSLYNAGQAWKGAQQVAEPEAAVPVTAALDGVVTVPVEPTVQLELPAAAPEAPQEWYREVLATGKHPLRPRNAWWKLYLWPVSHIRGRVQARQLLVEASDLSYVLVRAHLRYLEGVREVLTGGNAPADYVAQFPWPEVLFVTAYDAEFQPLDGGGTAAGGAVSAGPAFPVPSAPVLGWLLPVLAIQRTDSAGSQNERAPLLRSTNRVPSRQPSAVPAGDDEQADDGSLGICPIDMSEPAEVPLHEGHAACRECVVGHATACADDGSGARIPVPCPVCVGGADAVRIPAEALRPYLPVELLRRLLKAEFRLAGLTLVHCPHCGEALDMPAVPQARLGASGAGLSVRCAAPACRQRFCLDCERAWHPGRRCRWREEEAEATAAAATAATARAAQAESELRRMLNAEGSLIRCPCGEILQRNGGCNHMTHKKCAHAISKGRKDGTTHFCFVCGGELNNDGRTDMVTGQTHFPSGLFQDCGKPQRAVRL